jgi:pilus assembly protein CpaB
MRAVAIRVNEIADVAGFAVPGMRVDVLVSGSPPGAAALGGVTKTILQDVQVLSAGQNFQKDAEGKPVSVPVVNLLVTPEQAEMLSLASTQTSIQLVLRNPLDTDIAKTTGSAVAQLFHPGARSRGTQNRGRPQRKCPPCALRPHPRHCLRLPSRAWLR